MKYASLPATTHRAGSFGSSKPLPQSKTFDAYMEQAELCCEQARGALRCQRFGAARGLLSTATVLYQRALSCDGMAYPAVENRLRDIEQEINAYANATRHTTYSTSQRQA